MKTIEEKAKAYDEALERASHIKGYKTLTPQETAEYIFPELRESEDERMMRDFNDWLCEEIECRTNDLRDEKDRRTLNMLCYILTKVKEWLEKQKESLHISESCKENSDSFTSEDERIREALIEEFTNQEHVISWWGGVKIKDILAYLERQQEQKPAWSEEDEKKLELVTACIYEFYPNPVMKYELKDWLKSLRPSWKPSEEQMAVLLNAEGLMRANNYKENAKILAGLYGELKKLM